MRHWSVRKDSQRGVWWRPPPESAQKPVPFARRFFSGPGGMLMGPDNRTIDEEVQGQVARIALEKCPELPPEAPSFPAAEAVIHRIPAAKLPRQVPPGAPSAGEVQNPLQEQAVTPFPRA